MGVVVSAVAGPVPADADLADASAAGDPEAWAGIFDRYHRVIWQVAYGVLRRRSEAEDVVRATFLEAVDTIEGIPDPITLRPWLVSIAVRNAAAYADRVDTTLDDPIGGAEAAPGEGVIAAAFDSLTGDDRAALELAVRHRLTGAELAACLWLTGDRAHAQVDGAQRRFEAAVVAMRRLHKGLVSCAQLTDLVDNATPSKAVGRRRVVRHLARCDVCRVPSDPYLDARALLADLPIEEISDRASAQTRAAALEAAAGFALGPSGEGIWFDRRARRTWSERRRAR